LLDLGVESDAFGVLSVSSSITDPQSLAVKTISHIAQVRLLKIYIFAGTLE
jgi:hypothetical protein